MRICRLALVAVLISVAAVRAAEPAGGVRLAWADNKLTLHAPHLPGERVEIWYLEAYCRAGSTDRDWNQTVIKHQTRLLGASPDGRRIELEDRLADGLVVRHVLTAGKDDVTFELEARNPTDRRSEAHWAQPCVRVDRFTGRKQDDYLASCFLLVDGKVEHLPTMPWATRARYMPGQVYCPRHVDRNDVNPRPLSALVPSHALVGCHSADKKWLLATAWEPYQEIFQGVIVCLHSDFRLGGIEPGKTLKIRGKVYLTDAGLDALVARYRRDFPEHWSKKP